MYRNLIDVTAVSGKLNYILAGLIVCLPLLFFACTKNDKTPVTEATQNQILLKGNGTEPQDLDPHIVTGIPEHNIISALLEGLITEDPLDLSPKPGMAEFWETSIDHLTYRFILRKDARWSNGDPLTAADFVYSWQRMLSPELGSEYAYMLFCIKNAERYHTRELTDFTKVGVTAVSPYILEVTLNCPTPFFLSVLTHFSMFPVHRPTLEKHGAYRRGSKWTRPENYVGNGPFILKKWIMNKIIVVEKNPLYWDASQVRLKEIHFYPVDNIATEERMFRAGQLHITNTVPSEKIGEYRKNDPELIHIVPYLGTYYYIFNTLKAPFNDLRVRRAFAMSIDRKKIVEKVTKGGQLPAFAFTPPNIGGYIPQAHVPYDLEAARKLLAQAGYPQGEKFPAVAILYNTSEGHRKIAVAIQQMWKTALNVEVTLINQDWKVYLSSRKTKDFEIARAGWIGDYADPKTFLDMFVTGHGNNHTGWSDPRYDAIVTEANCMPDIQKRLALFQQAEKMIVDQAPVLPIYTYTNASLISSDVKGWYPNILDHHPYKHVYLESAPL